MLFLDLTKMVIFLKPSSEFKAQTMGNRFNEGRQNVLINDFSTGNLIHLMKHFNAIKMM